MRGHRFRVLDQLASVGLRLRPFDFDVVVLVVPSIRRTRLIVRGRRRPDCSVRFQEEFERRRLQDVRRVPECIVLVVLVDRFGAGVVVVEDGDRSPRSTISTGSSVAAPVPAPRLVLGDQWRFAGVASATRCEGMKSDR